MIYLIVSFTGVIAANHEKSIETVEMGQDSLDFRALAEKGFSAPLDLTELLLAFACGAVLAAVIRWHFSTFSRSITNRSEFMGVLPFILLTTILIIAIVKSSLALSLGLVGALSIVRFRTPIKEPEELAYIFLAIGSGLGLGAGQIIPTNIAVIVILALMACFLKFRGSINKHSGETYFSLSIPKPDRSSKITELALNDVFSIFLKYTKVVNLKRFQETKTSQEIVLYASECPPDQFEKLCSELRKNFKNIEITVIDQHNMPVL